MRLSPRSSRSFKVSRKSEIVTGLLLVGIIGYLDYSTGYDRPLLLFYLLPISLAAWFVGLITRLGIAALSTAVSTLCGAAAGIPSVRFWNGGMAFVCYA